ncbi:hypothetical protein [Streptomyces sp. NPDC088794]|uniref:hypothetical protein n=1 Tax=Streptomyces sp. NPDC088794 TaxID=3365902 RepID=UPI0037F78C4B
MTDDDGVCGATKTFPDDPERLKELVLPPTWAGVTVVCTEQPHEGPDAVHVGPVVVDGKLKAVSVWGPGWIPEFS